jgi:hypothetical protein
LFAWYSLSFSRLFAGMRKRKRKIMKKWKNYKQKEEKN